MSKLGQETTLKKSYAVQNLKLKTIIIKEFPRKVGLLHNRLHCNQAISGSDNVFTQDSHFLFNG